jgi:hypothetical protein
VWDGHSGPSPLTLIFILAVILRKRSRTRSGRPPTKDLCNPWLVHIRVLHFSLPLREVWWTTTTGRLSISATRTMPVSRPEA